MTAASPTNALVEALEDAGCRMTEPRRAVADMIASREGHFTAADLVEEARRRHPGLGRATVFRALDLFTSLNLVERVDLPDGDHAYVACEPAHHHHVICTRCGRSLDVDDHGLAEVLAQIGGRAGFRVTSHRLEIFGLCAACQMAQRPRVNALILGALLAALVAACRPASEASPVNPDAIPVVATTTILADLVHQVGGDRVRVESLVPKGGEVHTFDPTPSDIRRVTEARMVFRNGLGLDDWLGKLVADAGTNAKVVALAENLPGVQYLGGDHVGEATNPHLWMNVAYA